MADPANTRQIEDAGALPYPALDRNQVQKFMKDEYDTWVPLVRSMKLSLD